MKKVPQTMAEANAMREKAVRLDPLSWVARVNYINTLINTNRLAEADREGGPKS